jgi:NADPH:quinone reductase-like Zn-dependent oxidoreductase
VELKAASLNYRDLLMIKGLYDNRMPLPLIPLSDGAGVVVEVGSGVEKVKVGDRVAGAFFQSWIDGPVTREKTRDSLGGPRPGMLASHAVLEQAGTISIPDSVTFQEASTLPCTGVTAWNALYGGPQLLPGDVVLVQGTGGVSMSALTFAVAAGAKVIATSSSDEKLERVRSLGAFATINYHETPNWGAEVRKLTDGGVDHVIEVGGAGTFKQSLDAVRYGGHVAVIGVLAGVTAEVAATTILHKGIQIRGIYVGSTEMFRAMNRAIEANRIKPVIGHIFDFNDSMDAIRLMESAGHFGKIVISL